MAAAKKPAWRRAVTRFMKRVNKMDVMLAIMFISMFVFVVRMIEVYELTGGVPDTLIVSVFGVCTGECGIMGWIKSSKERKQDRKWAKEDMKRERESGGINHADWKNQ